MADELRVYTINEAAEILKLNPRTVYNYVRAGKIEAARFGRAYRISEDALRKLMEAGGISK